MKRKQAFTLLEVLISLSISTFILLGMVQIYSNVVSFISRTHDTMYLSQRVFILFGQFENDITTAFISDFHEPIKPKAGQASETKEKEVKDILPKQSKQDYNCFVGQINEDERERIRGKSWDLFKSLNFINTNPLQVYSQNYPRLVRVKYELLKNKKKSTSDINVYSLFRKETLNIKNFDFKLPEDTAIKEKNNII